MSVNFVAANSVPMGPDINGATARDVPGVTLACWIRLASAPASTTNLIGIATGTSTTNPRAVLGITSSTTLAQARAGDAEATRSSTLLRRPLTGVWTHVATSIDYANDLIRIYLDGVRLTNAAAPFTAAASSNTESQSILLGVNLGLTSYFDGLMEDIRVYGRALSDSEVATLANSRGADDLYTDMQWRFIAKDGNDGTAISDALGLAVQPCNNYVVGPNLPSIIAGLGGAINYGPAGPTRFAARPARVQIAG